MKRSRFLRRLVKGPVFAVLALCALGALGAQAAEPDLVVPHKALQGVSQVVFSPDGKHFLVDEANSIYLWSLDKAELVCELRHADGPVAFSPDGKHILAAGNNTVGLFVLGQRKVNRYWELKYREMLGLYFYPDGKRVLVTLDTGAGIIDLVENRTLTTYRKPYRSHIDAGALSADGKRVVLFSGDPNEKPVILDGNLRSARFAQQGDRINDENALAVSPNGRYFANGGWINHGARLWDAQTGRIVRNFKKGRGLIFAVAFSPDSRRLLTAGAEGTVFLWDVASGRLIRELKGHRRTINTVAFSPDGARALSGAMGDGVKLWDLKTGKLIASFYHLLRFKGKYASGDPWCIITADGWYKGSKGVEKGIQVRKGLDLAWLDQKGRGARRWPDLVRARLGTDSALLAGVWKKGPPRQPEPVPARPKKGTGSLAKAKSVQKSKAKPVAKSSASGVKDKKPPRITLAQRGVSVQSKVKKTLVRGRALDESGVVEVTVNGKDAALDARGNFSCPVYLRPGRNRVVVTAMDVHGNRAALTSSILRQEGQVAAVGSPAGAPKPGPVRASYVALVVGIDSYRKLPRLATAVNDAKAVAGRLERDYGFKVRLLLNAKATRAGVIDALNDLRKKLKPQDRLLIYYAGHGYFDRAAQKAYWLPADASPDSNTNWIIVDSVTSNLKGMAARHVLVVSDSCYSGTLSRSLSARLDGKDTRKRYLEKMMRKQSRVLIASGGNEPVADGGGGGHSVFAKAFLQALKEEERKSFTAGELFVDHIREAVAGSAKQTPEYSIIRDSGHAGGDFIFQRR